MANQAAANRPNLKLITFVTYILTVFFFIIALLLLDNRYLTALIWSLPILVFVGQTTLLILGLRSVFYGYLTITVSVALWAGSLLVLCIAGYFKILSPTWAWAFTGLLIFSSGWYGIRKYQNLRWDAVETKWRRAVDIDSFQFDFSRFAALATFFQENSGQSKWPDRLNRLLGFIFGYGIGPILAFGMIAGRLSVKAGLPDFRLLLIAFIFGPMIVNGLAGYGVIPGWANLRTIIRLEQEIGGRLKWKK